MHAAAWMQARHLGALPRLRAVVGGVRELSRDLRGQTGNCGLMVCRSGCADMTHERQRTSSAELETSATISLGTQLDSSLLVLVADVSSFALRPIPIFTLVSAKPFSKLIDEAPKRFAAELEVVFRYY